MSELSELPRIVRRRSEISGWGVYAAQPIDEDTRIVEYKGQLVSQAEAWRRELRYLPRQRIWLFTINTRWARDAAVGGNVGRYVNHAVQPELLCRHRRSPHLDPRLAQDPQGRGADLRLQHGRRRRDSLPLPSPLPPDDLTAA